MVRFRVNGENYQLNPEPRELLVHTLRESCRKTGTHVGCDTGTCGACTVELDGRTVKSCTIFTVQVDGSSVTTIEGTLDSELHEKLRSAMHECGAVQCGYCTPGMVMTGANLIEEGRAGSREEICAGLKGNLCMCTGYTQIVEAIESVAKQTNGGTHV